MKRYIWFVFVLCLSISACHKEEKPAQEGVPNPRASGKNITITQQDIQNGLDLLDEQDRKFAQTSFGKQNLLQILAREKLILQDARSSKLEENEEYQAALKQKRAELDTVYDHFAQEALVRTWYEQKEKEIEPSEKEIKVYYNKYPYEMTIKQIIVDNAQTADQTLKILKGSPGRWNEISRQQNKAPAALQTLTFMPGEYLDNLEAVAANSSIGKVQGFFKTPQGFHIIMKTGENRLSLEQATPRIRQILINQRLDKLLDTLKTKYEVVIYDENK